jgi:hypothetical protein
MEEVEISLVVGIALVNDFSNSSCLHIHLNDVVSVRGDKEKTIIACKSCFFEIVIVNFD